MSNRNRTAGHNYERQTVRELTEMGFDVVTARSESRNLDNLGIDVMGRGENPPPHDIQCKVKKTLSNNEIVDLLSRGRPDVKPLVVLHKKVKKANTRFVTEGEFVYMSKDTYYGLLNEIEHLKEYIRAMYRDAPPTPD